MKHIYTSIQGGTQAGKRREKTLGFDVGQQFRREGGRISISREIFNNLNISTNSKVPALPPSSAKKYKPY